MRSSSVREYSRPDSRRSARPLSEIVKPNLPGLAVGLERPRRDADSSAEEATSVLMLGNSEDTRMLCF